MEKGPIHRPANSNISYKKDRQTLTVQTSWLTDAGRYYVEKYEQFSVNSSTNNLFRVEKINDLEIAIGK
jgi:hypothetical protein